MGLLFLLLLISAGITYLSHAWTENNNNKRENCVAGAIISSALTAVVFIIIWAGSYVSFLEMEKNLATIEQYSSAVKLYAEKGVAEFKPGSGQPSEFTDLKYQNYQGQIGQMIKDLRYQVKEYNSDLTGKKLMKDNWFFSWCIIMPNNTKIITMQEYLK